MEDAFSFEQQSVLTGSLLGDGHLTKPRSRFGNATFTKTQKRARRKYLEWHAIVFGDFTSSVTDNTSSIKEKTYLRSRFATVAHPFFSALRSKWYPDGKKIVPRGIRLDPLSLCIWFMDDGYNNVKNRVASFATQSFNRRQCNILISELSFMGLNAYYKLSDRTVTLRSRSYDDFIDLIKPYVVWDCFSYKTVKRDKCFSKLTDHDKTKIEQLYRDGYVQTAIAEQMRVAIGTVSRVLRKGRKGGAALNSISGIKGIMFEASRKKWRATKKGRCIGRFVTKEEAIAALENE